MYPVTPKQRSWKPWIIAAIAAAGIGWAWSARPAGVDWSRVGTVFTSADPAWLALSIGLALAAYLIRAFRWAVLLEPVRDRPDYMGLVSATVIGFTAIVIFGRAGELVRPYLIARGQRVPFASQMAAWLTERVWDLLMALAIFGLSLRALQSTPLVIPPRLAAAIDASGAALVVMVTACLATLLGFRWLAPLFRGIAAWLGTGSAALGKFALHFVDSMAGVSTPVRAVKMLAWSLVEWAAIYLCCYALFRATSATWAASALDILIVVGFITFGAVVQIPGIGGGTQIVTTLVLHELFHVPLPDAIGTAWLIWLVTFVVILPAGLYFAAREGIGWGRMRSLTQAARQGV